MDGFQAAVGVACLDPASPTTDNVFGVKFIDRDDVTEEISTLSTDPLSLAGISHYITPYHITSHHITSHHTISHHITSHHITLHYSISHHITSYHITSHYTISHHITPYHITLHYTISHHITSHHITSHYITPYHITYLIDMLTFLNMQKINQFSTLVNCYNFQPL